MATDKRLTKRTVDAAPIRAERYSLWDSALPGFGLTVSPTGRKTFVLRYRAKGVARPAPKRFILIGQYGPLAPEAARRAATQLLAAVARGVDPAKTKIDAAKEMTVAECAEQFLNHHVARKRKFGTFCSYRQILQAHALPRLGTRLASSLTRSEVSTLQGDMAATPAAANRLLAVLSSMFNWAERFGHVPEGFNPTRKIERYRVRGRARYLSEHELARLASSLVTAEEVGIPYTVDESKPTAKHAPRLEYRRVIIGREVTAAIRLLLMTGCRLREVLRLRWTDVDIERALFVVRDSKTGPKTVLLSRPALEVIVTLPKVGDFLFPGHDGNKPRSDLKRPWQMIRRHADLSDVRIHDLRHSFASIGVETGLSLPVLSKLLGHSQIASTARYAHVGDDPLRRASEAIALAINTAMNRHSRQAPASEGPLTNDLSKD